MIKIPFSKKNIPFKLKKQSTIIILYIYYNNIIYSQLYYFILLKIDKFKFISIIN